ncbi:adenylate kinase family enzyme [Pararhizobium capsulatum DSM 1112]|uniref:Adenylate kinase family enzyme n=1 Tax=Pararhizobium capsulatum DSM 1112 TaxID=1121113 RepID=A0ABU0BPD7_9HYPH|nr:AAA family ATPase [Pararhizobium capsulatum]MDQ0320114.1 adenylate kinase family enzyme [Pararhizobium capsulatum DSM 1112]
MARYLDTLDQAADILQSAERILLIGCSGSGKSTLATALAKRFGLTYISMDREVFWMPGWTPRPRAEALDRLRAFVDEPRWVIDGTSPGTLPLRLPRTDILIWLRPPRRISLYGVISRWWKFRGRTRPEMADGCPERVTIEFLRYIWNFEKTQTPEIEAALEKSGTDVPLIVLKSRAMNERLLALVTGRD